MKRKLIFSGSLLLALLLAASCGGGRPVPPAPEATAVLPQPAETAQVVALPPTPEALQPGGSKPAATVAPEATTTGGPPAAGPPAAGLSAEERAPVFTVGVPAGDAYQPISAAIDEARGLAYVYHGNSAERRPVISVVDLRVGQVTKLFRLGATSPIGQGRLLLAPDAGTAYVIDGHNETLISVDVQSGAIEPAALGMRDGVLSEDGRILYAIGSWGLRAFDLAGLFNASGAPLWEAGGAQYDRIVRNGESLLVSVIAPERGLVSFDARTGREIARASVDFASGIAAGPDGGWAVTESGEQMRLIRLDAALAQTAEGVIPYTNDVTYDATRGRYLVAGYLPGRSSTKDRPLVWALSDGDLTRVAEQAWPDQQAPAVFVPWGSDRLVGFAASGAARLDLMDTETLAPAGRIITGAHAVDLVLDDGAGVLYVADDHDRIHVLRLPQGEESAVWEGGSPLVLDPANRRLYANGSQGVRSLDLATGEVLAEFPQRGYPAPDPNRDLVYIAEAGVTLYNRSGQRLGQWNSTFPAETGFSPNPYAYAARVNPVTGHVAVAMNNGIPGSNNGSFLRVHPAEVDAPVTAASPHSFVMNVASDVAGAWYVSYSPARGQEAIQVLSPSGQEQRRLNGRTGAMVLDEGQGRLHLFLGGTVTELDAGTLTPLHIYEGPAFVEALEFSPSRRTLYFVSGMDARVATMRLADLKPVDLRPQSGSPAPDMPNEGLAVATDGRSSTVLAQFGGLYRTGDGQLWEKLPVGVQSTYGHITTVAPNTVFFVGQGSMGADGVWRSLDAGESWELLDAGLADLRPIGPLLARGSDEAYFRNQRQGLLRWDAEARRWQPVGGQPKDGQWGELALAPDGTLFRTATALLERSPDRGETWEALDAPDGYGEIIGFSPLYTVTHTLFGAWHDTEMVLMRSQDAGATWEPLDLGAPLPDDAYAPELSSGHGSTYLLVRRYGGAPLLMRSTDFGGTWEAAPPEVAAGVEHIAADPVSAVLWLGFRGGVRGIKEQETVWAAASLEAAPVVQAAQPASSPAPRLTPRVPAQPVPTAGPCEEPLTGADADINSRGYGVGCPQGSPVSMTMARQRFQHGQMIWRSDDRSIYVLGEDGRWEVFADRWVEGEPSDDPALAAPEGLQQPVRGFGKLWRGELGAGEAAIGWALEKEQGLTASVQAWQHGLVFRFGGEVLVLREDGAWR